MYVKVLQEQKLSRPQYFVRLIRKDDGGLHPILTVGGRPLVLPNLWADELSLSTRFNTVRSYLADITLLYRWADKSGIDLHERFSSLTPFRKAELRQLANAACVKADGTSASAATCDRRLQSIRYFIAFAVDNFVEQKSIDFQGMSQAEKNKQAMHNRLGRLFSSKINVAPGPQPSTPLSSDELKVVSDVLHPASELNPFRGKSVRFRNYCMFHLAVETWARRSELVLLEIADLEFGSTPTVCLKAPSTKNANRRRDGANLKTRGRVIPISKELGGLLQAYVCGVRDDLLRPGVPSTALFVSARDGRRLASGAFNTLMRQVAEVPQVSALKKRLHPHGLRATGASLFRIQAGAKENGLSKDEFRDCITYLGGWNSNSKMVQRYTRQAIYDRIQKRLALQGRTIL